MLLSGCVRLCRLMSQSRKHTRPLRPARGRNFQESGRSEYTASLRLLETAKTACPAIRSGRRLPDGAWVFPYHLFRAPSGIRSLLAAVHLFSKQ